MGLQLMSDKTELNKELLFDLVYELIIRYEKGEIALESVQRHIWTIFLLATFSNPSTSTDKTA
jgi:hypothetical protein